MRVTSSAAFKRVAPRVMIVSVFGLNRHLHYNCLWRCRPCPGAVVHFGDHFHGLPDGERPQRIAAGIERSAVVEAGIDSDNLPLHQLRYFVISAAGEVASLRSGSLWLAVSLRSAVGDEPSDLLLLRGGELAPFSMLASAFIAQQRLGAVVSLVLLPLPHRGFMHPSGFADDTFMPSLL